MKKTDFVTFYNKHFLQINEIKHNKLMELCLINFYAYILYTLHK